MITDAEIDADLDQSPYGMVFPQDRAHGTARFRRVGGMDLLEYYTGKALAGILANSNNFPVDEEAANQAVSFAKATIARLEKERGFKK